MERGEHVVNNLVYTKRQKHIYTIRKHETTVKEHYYLINLTTLFRMQFRSLEKSEIVDVSNSGLQFNLKLLS